MNDERHMINYKGGKGGKASVVKGASGGNKPIFGPKHAGGTAGSRKFELSEKYLGGGRKM